MSNVSHFKDWPMILSRFQRAFAANQNIKGCLFSSEWINKE
jgi:hypothetical protein